MKLPSILALDPGGFTGYMFRGPDATYEFGELPLSADGHHLALWKLLENCRARTQRHDSEADLVIVCERFDYRKDDVETRAKIDFISREYIGVVKLYVATATDHVRLRLQGAAEAKAFWTDDKLRKIGLYYGKSKHARDATRHYLYYITFNLKDPRYLNMLKTQHVKSDPDIWMTTEKHSKS